MRKPARALLPLLAVLAAGWALPSSKRQPLPGREVYQRTLPGVAWVLAADRGKGTGFLVDRERRQLVTAYHVVGDQPTAWVVFPDADKGTVVSPRQHYLEQM